jgi:hypothetical protein
MNTPEQKSTHLEEVNKNEFMDIVEVSIGTIRQSLGGTLSESSKHIHDVLLQMILIIQKALEKRNITIFKETHTTNDTMETQSQKQRDDENPNKEPEIPNATYRIPLSTMPTPKPFTFTLNTHHNRVTGITLDYQWKIDRTIKNSIAYKNKLSITADSKTSGNTGMLKVTWTKQDRYKAWGRILNDDDEWEAQDIDEQEKLTQYKGDWLILDNKDFNLRHINAPNEIIEEIIEKVQKKYDLETNSQEG